MEEKIIERKWEDGALFDVSEATCRAMDIIRTADEVTDEKAKFKLLEGVTIILADCIEAIKTRVKNGDISSNEAVINVTEEIDD